VYIIVWLVCSFTYFTFVVQIIKFTAILLVRSFNDTSRLKRKPLPFQMNIDKGLSENGINLDDDVLYNFTDVSSQLMWDDGITPWRGPQEKHPLFYYVWLMPSQNPKVLQTSLLPHVWKNLFFSLKLFLIHSLHTKMLSFVVILITVCFMFDRALHTCLSRFETSHLGIGRW
jgi:hypothetical protein